MGRREEGKRQAAKYRNSKGVRLRRWHKWSASDNSVRYTQRETGKKYNPERALNRQGEKEEVKSCMEKAPCRTGGMKMGRRLVMVYKVITCLLISNIAFPRILLGISRLHVHGWSCGLTSRMLSVKAQHWAHCRLVPSIQVIPAQAEQLYCKTLPRLPVTASKLPPTYCRALLTQPGWVAGFSFGLVWGFFCWFSH